MVQSEGATVPPPSPEETAPELERLLQALPADEARELRTALVQSSSFRGPLPPPALLAHYEDILPGAADRIMTMAEAEQAHRIWWERRDMATASNTAIGSEVGAGLFLGVGVIGVIGRFLSHRWNNGGDGQARS